MVWLLSVIPGEAASPPVSTGQQGFRAESAAIRFGSIPILSAVRGRKNSAND
jgi:phage FluMu gp28-like protein